MAFQERIRKKLERKEKTYETEQLMKEKRSEEYQALEEVFDRPTLMTIYDLMNKGEIGEIHGVVSAGKEARVYWGKNPRGEEIAIKIFLIVSAEFRKGMLPYILGDPRFKNIRKDSRSLIYAWALKEYKNLYLAYRAKVRVPHPIIVQNNVILMEFIGKDGVRAPLLKEAALRNPQRAYQRLIASVNRLYRRAKLVHGDLSEYNVMVWKGNLVIFDVSQSVTIEHPNSGRLLVRDLENLNRYFKKLDVEVIQIEELYRRITDATITR